MKFKELIDNLEELVEDASKLPLSNKCMIDKEELFEVIKQIRLAYPEDLKQAEYVKKERDRILQDAEKEAEIIKEEAKNKVAKMVNESEIVRGAREKATEILNEAQANASAIIAQGQETAKANAEESQRELAAYQEEVMTYIANVLHRAETASENAVSTVAKAINDMNGQYDALRAVYEALSKNRMAIVKK